MKNMIIIDMTTFIFLNKGLCALININDQFVERRNV